MERNDKLVSLSLFQAKLIESNCVRIVFVESKRSFLFFKRVAVVARTVVSNRIGSYNANSYVFPTATNLRRVSKLNVVVHRLRDIVNGERNVTAFIHFQKSWPSPCCWSVRIILANDNRAVL